MVAAFRWVISAQELAVGSVGYSSMDQPQVPAFGARERDEAASEGAIAEGAGRRCATRMRWLTGGDGRGLRLRRRMVMSVWPGRRRRSAAGSSDGWRGERQACSRQAGRHGSRARRAAGLGAEGVRRGRGSARRARVAGARCRQSAGRRDGARWARVKVSTLAKGVGGQCDPPLP